MEVVHKMPENNRTHQILELSEKILESLEDSDKLSQILPKCMRLARYLNDPNSMNWLTLELSGYKDTEIPAGIKREELGEYAIRSGRCEIRKNAEDGSDQIYYWFASVPELEGQISSYEACLPNIHPPAHFTPTITKASDTSFMAGSTFATETYNSVLQKVRTEQNSLMSNITFNTKLLSKIRTKVYSWVVNIYYQFRFGEITESLFQRIKGNVDTSLMEVCPDTLKQFVAAYERLDSDNPEEWSQAMSTCRNILQDFTGILFPPQREKYTLRDGSQIQVTEDKYKNRLIAYLDSLDLGRRDNNLLRARIDELITKVHALNDMLSKGTHEGINNFQVNICVIETYFLISSLLDIWKRNKESTT